MGWFLPARGGERLLSVPRSRRRLVNQASGQPMLATVSNSARDAECERARELHEPCERDAGDALSVFSRWGGNRSAKDKWGPVFDRIEAKYTPATGAALKRLSAKYQYSFSSDGSIAPAAANADSNNTPVSNASKPNPIAISQIMSEAIR